MSTENATAVQERRVHRTKKGGGFFQATVTLHKGETAALDKIADELGRDRSDLLREAARAYWLKGRRTG